MKIKDKLSLYFTLLSSTILLIAMATIYVSFYELLQIDFFNRLKDRISIATRLYIEADEQSRAALSNTREKYQEKIPGETIRIYDGSNDAAFIPDEKHYWTDKIINEVRENGSIEYSDHGRYVVGTYYKDDQGDFVILASAPDPGRIAQLNNFMIIVASIYLLSIIFVFFISRLFAEKMLSPINKLIDQLQKINASTLDTRVDVSRENDEIGILASNFNEMLSKLENSFELQKRFVANTSHELRTPITSIIGEAEVSLRLERNAEEYRSVIGSILTESEKLNETVSGLIDLAQVDIHFKRLAVAPLRIDDLIWELHEYWSKKLYPNALIVNMDHVSQSESSLIIKANKTLLTIALNNIINNAFKFSKNSPVNCTLETSDESLKIKVEDSGMGIEQSEMEKVFEAFYRSVRSAPYPGNGIGLYVTQRIIRLLNGDIDIESSTASGTTINVNFRVAKVVSVRSK